MWYSKHFLKLSGCDDYGYMENFRRSHQQKYGRYNNLK